MSAFNVGIAQDKAYLKEQGDIISKNYTLINSLLNKDRNSLLEILKNEKDKRSIGLMGLADSEGVIIGRTLTVGKYGDNVFLTAPAGRVVAQGKSVQSIELSSFNNQIFMTTARPVMQDTTMIGALFANYLLDDTYTATFKNKYVSAGTEIVFYTKTYGVYGNSFTDPTTRKLVDSYFNTGSSWIKDGDSGKTIDFGDSRSYIVENVVFPGLEQSPGGALIFIPRKDISNFANTITAFFTFLVFLLLALRHHIHTPSEERGWRYYLIVSIFALIVFVLTFFILRTQNSGRLRLERIPYVLYNSTIHFQPESGIYNIGTEQHFSVVVDTGDEPINVVQIALKFDPDAVEMTSLNASTSTCSYIAENAINQEAGTASLVCGILNSKEGQQSISIADVTLVPRRIGTANLSFDTQETKILANDGLGTNVLRTSQDGSYRFDNFSTSTGISFVVFSPTHPNESRWYNQKVAHFIWMGKTDAVYHYTLDTSPDTVPTNDHTLKGSSADITIPGDGIYYFHLQLVSGGPVAHYRIKSDMTPPTILAMNSSQSTIVEGDVVRFSFDAQDTVSGIQHNYYIDLGNHLFLPIGQQLFVPFLEAGNQKVTLRVYDSAGNYSEKSQIVHVENKK
jgi:hypothetical protein